jgi:ubiquinone/menaquinone biosynthesis C-methylase UbiE
MEHLLRATARAEAQHFWFRGLRAFTASLVKQALAGKTLPAIVDCGCGTGANVARLAAHGRAFGFDRSEAGLRLGREAGRTGLVVADVTAAPFPDAVFDLVTSFDVLYSLSDDAEKTAVAEMWRVMRPGGYLLVNVAALAMLTGDHSVLSRERRRYTRASLSALLEAAGFEIVRITYAFATLFPPLAVVRAVQRFRGLRAEGETEREITVPPAPFNALLTALLLAEAVWLRRFDNRFGSSLLCLARKPASPSSA